MPDSHPEIDKDRAGKKFILTHFPAWDWYDTESMARTVADKAQDVIDGFIKERQDAVKLFRISTRIKVENEDLKIEVEELRRWLRDLGHLQPAYKNQPEDDDKLPLFLNDI